MNKINKHLVLTPETVKNYFGDHRSKWEDNIIGNDIILVTNSYSVENNMPRHTMLRSDSPILAVVTDGIGSFTINYENYKLSKGTMLKIPIGTVFSINSLSADWNLQVLDFRIPETAKSGLFFYRLEMINLSDDDFIIMYKYFELLRLCMKDPDLDYSSRCIVQAMVYNANKISQSASRIPEDSVSRVKRVYFNFMSEILRDRDMIKRTVGFYADLFGISENSLSNAVKEASNKTVMEWINKICIDNAKIMLRANRMSISEISHKVGFKDQSSFSRFFKHETGLTPAEYRKQKRKEEEGV